MSRLRAFLCVAPSMECACYGLVMHRALVEFYQLSRLADVSNVTRLFVSLPCIAPAMHRAWMTSACACSVSRLVDCYIARGRVSRKCAWSGDDVSGLGLL